MTTTTNAENLRQCKSRFSLIVEQILVLAASINLVREVKNLFPDSNRLAQRCFTLKITLIGIERFLLSENFN